MENKIFAGLRLRLLAGYVDLAILSLPITFLLFYAGTSSNIPIFVQRSFLLLIVLLLFIIINLLHDIFFTHYFGGTIGKLLTGLRVIDENGNKLTLKRSFFRHTVGYQFSSILFGLGFLSIIKDPQKQAWHDKAVGSKVIVQRKNWLLALLVLLSIIILNLYILYSAFTTAFFGPLPDEFQTFANSLQTKQEKTKPSTGSTEPTAGWQIHRNDQFGFEVRYPNEWKVIDSEKEGALRIYLPIPSTSLTPKGIGSSIFLKYKYDELVTKNKHKGLSLDEWIKNPEVRTILRGIPYKMPIGNVEMYGLDATSLESDFYVMDKEKRVYLISTLARGDQDFNTLLQILSTFRFVE